MLCLPDKFGRGNARVKRLGQRAALVQKNYSCSRRRVTFQATTQITQQKPRPQEVQVEVEEVKEVALPLQRVKVAKVEIQVTIKVSPAQEVALEVTVKEVTIQEKVRQEEPPRRTLFFCCLLRS